MLMYKLTRPARVLLGKTLKVPNNFLFRTVQKMILPRIYVFADTSTVNNIFKLQLRQFINFQTLTQLVNK